MAVYWLLERGFSPQRILGARASSVAILYGMAVFAITLASALCHVRPDRLAYCVAFAVFIWLADSLRERCEGAGTNVSAIVRLPWNALVWLGTISYSLYLVHNELSYFGHRLLMLVGLRNGVVVDGAVVVGTIAATALFFHFCERPFLQSSADPSPARLPLPARCEAVQGPGLRAMMT